MIEFKRTLNLLSSVYEKIKRYRTSLYLITFLGVFFFESGSHYIDQSGLKLRAPPASASPVLGLEVYISMLSFGYILN
jgi:hypothetical protein